MGISLNPKDAVKGGSGLFGGNAPALAVFTGAKFTEFDYNGTVPQPVVALQLEYSDEAGAPQRPQFYSVGDLTTYAIIDDGEGLNKLKRKSDDDNGLSTNCNAYAFLESLIAGGFPADKIQNKISVIVGTKALLTQRPKRAFKNADGTEVPNTGKTDLLVAVGGVKELPSALSGNHAGNGKATATQVSQAADVDVDAKATEMVGKVLAAKGGKIQVNDDFKLLSMLVYAQVNQAKPALPGPVKKAVIARVSQPNFLFTSDAWAYDADSGAITVS